MAFRSSKPRASNPNQTKKSIQAGSGGRVSRDATPNGRLDGYQSMDTGRELKRRKKFSTKRRL
jgi:hypothetical protein